MTKMRIESSVSENFPIEDYLKQIDILVRHTALPKAITAASKVVVNDAKIDDDIWFWNTFRQSGRRVWVDVETRIGHMEEMIAIYDENLQPKHIYPEQWREQFLSKKETASNADEASRQSAG